MNDLTDAKVEHVLSGDHFRVETDNGLEVGLEGIDNDRTETVDRRRFEDGPWQVEA